MFRILAELVVRGLARGHLPDTFSQMQRIASDNSRAGPEQDLLPLEMVLLGKEPCTKLSLTC